MASLVESRVERKEDQRFLTGKGRYTADINLANQTYAIFVRSPHARAKIKKLDTSKALKSSGVISVLTGAYIANDKIGGLIAGWRIKSEDGSDMKVPDHPALANETVNYVVDHLKKNSELTCRMKETLSTMRQQTNHEIEQYKIDSKEK